MEKITGILEKVIYRDIGNGFHIFKIAPYSHVLSDERNGVICQGVSPDFEEGSPVELIYQDVIFDGRGNIRYLIDLIFLADLGRQTTVTFIKENIKGVGQKKAEKLYDAIGEPFFENIRSGISEKVCKTAGISKKDAERIVGLCGEKLEVFLLYRQLSRYGIELSETEKMYDAFGPATKRKLDEDPYLMIKFDIPFQTADQYAYDRGLGAFCNMRICGIATELMKKNRAKGHSYLLPKRERIQKYLSTLQKHSSYSDIPTSLDILYEFRTGNYKTEYDESGNPAIYLPADYYNEKDILFHLKRLSENKGELIKGAVEKASVIEEQIQTVYSEDQLNSFRLLETSGVKLITGGPGTGKTTVINGFIRLFEKNHPEKKIVLAAPTGRAAARMEEVTGKEASTVHRCLKLRPYRKGSESMTGIKNIDAGMIIIDEMSMMDLSLTSALLRACPDGCILLLCGDVDQLSSISPGNVFADLIHSGQFECAVLTKNHRQEGRTITENGRQILKGEAELVQNEQFQIEEITSDNFEEMIKERYSSDTFLLCPTGKGGMGVRICNRFLQEKMTGFMKIGFTIRKQSYHLSDRIVFTRNNYEVEDPYYNGETGTILEICGDHIIVGMDGGGMITVKRKDFGDFMLAYAMTVHKAQGSEEDTVLILLPERYRYMIDRNLLYTAVTRARKNVRILEEKGVLEECILHGKAEKRNSRLDRKLCGDHFFLSDKFFSKERNLRKT